MLWQKTSAAQFYLHSVKEGPYAVVHVDEVGELAAEEDVGGEEVELEVRDPLPRRCRIRLHEPRHLHGCRRELAWRGLG